MSRFLLLSCFALSACLGGVQKDTGEEEDEDQDTSEDSGETGETGDTGETGETGDSEETAAPVPVALEAAASAPAITTRETLTFTVTVTYDDGSTTDVTGDATYTSNADAVLKFYDPGVGQPLGAGSAGWSVSWGELAPVTGTVDVTVVAAAAGDLVINEILADATVTGDPNGDGTLHDVQDEFLEIANLSAVTVDLGGVTVLETDFTLPRHTFAAGTLLRAGEAIVLFGGGSVSSLSAANVSFVTCVNDDSSLPYGLSLHNDGEAVQLSAADGSVITQLAYGTADTTGQNDAIEDASLVLSPDVYGATYTHHSYATGSAGDFSPGTYVDGSAYPGPDWTYAQ